jgi:hypothetical protein
MKEPEHPENSNSVSRPFQIALSFLVILTALVAATSANAAEIVSASLKLVPLTISGAVDAISPSAAATDLIPGPVATLVPTRLLFVCRNVINVGCLCINYRTAKLSNTGSATLLISRVTITGEFYQTNNCGTGLGVGKSCTIAVHWRELGSVGTLDVFDNAPNSPQKVSLLGIKECTR